MPSRGNWDLVKKTLDSFQRTTAYPKKIEWLIVFDKGTAVDLPELIKAEQYDFEVKCFYRPHSEWWTKDYFNFLADRTIGKNICAFNDDAYMRTCGWDKSIKKKLKDLGWSVYLVDLPDSARIKYGHPFPCFPMVSREGFIATGYFFNEQVKVYPADKVLHGLYSNIERVIKIEDVYIQHNHVIESDSSKSRFMEIFIEQRDKGELKIDISLEVMILLRLIKKECSKKRNKFSRIINILKEK